MDNKKRVVFAMLSVLCFNKKKKKKFKDDDEDGYLFYQFSNKS